MNQEMFERIDLGRGEVFLRPVTPAMPSLYEEAADCLTKMEAARKVYEECRLEYRRAIMALRCEISEALASRPRCIAEKLEGGRCSRLNGYGKDGLYCRQHSRMN